MACTSPPLTLSNAQAGDMALDQAIYHSGRDKIFGVRGQWLFRFNATTGALEASLRFQANGGGMSTISTIGNVLYIGTTFASDDNITDLVTPFASRDIYTVDATTFLVTGSLGFASKLGAATAAGTRTDLYYARGWRQIVTDGAKLWGFQSGDGLWRASLPGYNSSSFQVSTDIAYDGFNNVIWVADPYTPNLWVWSADLANDTFDTGGIGRPTGVCYVPLTNHVYCVNGTLNLFTADASLAVPAFNPFPTTGYSTGRINANPYKVKYVDYPSPNPLAHMVLIPAFADDTVIVWNPVTYLVADVKTGFTAPFDIVSTPTANFAVQTSPTGLKLIT